MKKLLIWVFPLLMGICISCNKNTSTDNTGTVITKTNDQSYNAKRAIRPEDCYNSMEDLLSWYDALYEPGDEITIKYLPAAKQYCITNYSNPLKGKF